MKWGTQHPGWRWDYVLKWCIWRATRDTISHRARVNWGELMFIYKRGVGVLAAMVFFITAASAKQAPAKGGAVFRTARINVVVTTASGECVTDLEERDFKVFDNNVTQQPIVFFRAGTMSHEEVEIPQLVFAAATRINRYCFGETGLFRYEITFSVPGDARVNEYRRVCVRVDRPDLVVWARQGYYVQH